MKNKTAFRLTVLLCLLSFSVATAQVQDSSALRARQDSTVRLSAPQRDSALQVEQAATDTLLAHYKPLHSPRKAAFYSAVLPGLGQIYNREYWKVPVVYAALGVSAGFFIGNMDYYREFRDAYRMRVANRENPGYVDTHLIYTDDDLKYLRDAYRQYMDYSVLVFVAAYALNIVDATVFAHLRQFDISDDLSMRVSPRIIGTRAVGLGVTFSLGGRKARTNSVFAFH
ncbi:DUF5683 domain-containing protein [Chitinophaga lutea]